MSDSFTLAELVAARAFHDIGGMAGTLTATLELALQVGQDAGGNLIAAVETAADLSRRVRLLRAAWGPTEGRLDLAGLHDLALGVPGAHRVRLDLSALASGTVFAPGLGRLLLNVAVLAAECLPRGGTLALAGIEDGLLARLMGPRAAWPAGFAAVLADEAAAWAALTDARRLTAPLLALLARNLG
ncbi:MAG: histidine phosphotransferase family protein, partial [Acetobacteraceae bacterium]